MESSGRSIKLSIRRNKQIMDRKGSSTEQLPEYLTDDGVLERLHVVVEQRGVSWNSGAEHCISVN
jgi:hypothetical protein